MKGGGWIITSKSLKKMIVASFCLTTLLNPVATSYVYAIEKTTQEMSSETVEEGSEVSETTQSTTDSSATEETVNNETDSTNTVDTDSEITETTESSETTASSATEETQDSAEKQVTTFAETLEVVTIAIENEAHLRAVLLGQTFTLADGTSVNYGTVADTTQLVLEFSNSLQLTAPILESTRKHVVFSGTGENIAFSQAAAQNNIENYIQFTAAESLQFNRITFSNVLSANGLIQTQGATAMTFTDSTFAINNATGRIVNNEAASIQFTGTNSLTTGTTAIPVLFTAQSVNIEGSFTGTVSGTGANPFFAANKVTFADASTFRFEKNNAANTGSVVHLTGTAAEMTMGVNSSIYVRQTGMFVSVPNSNQDSVVTLESGAVFDGGLGQGFSGSSVNTIGEMHLANASQFKYSEFGTVTPAAPAINVGRRFVTAAATDEASGVSLEATRNATANVGAFVHLRAVNSTAELGSFTKTNITQHGPMFTGVATSAITVGDYTTINNTNNRGFNGTVAVDSIAIGNNVSINITEPTTAITGTSYNTFFANTSFTLGNDSSISAPRTRTTGSGVSDNLIRLNTSNGTITIGNNSVIEANQQGALIHALQADITFGEYSRVDATLGRGVTNGYNVANVTLKKGAVMNLTEHSVTQAAVARFIVQGTFLMEADTSISSTRASTGEQGLVQFAAANARFTTNENAKINVGQRGPLIAGNATTDAVIGTGSEVSLTTSNGFTGNTALRRLDVGQNAKVTVTEPATGNLARQYFTFRDEILIRENAEVSVTRTSTNNTMAFRLTAASSRFTTLAGSTLNVSQLGPVLGGTTTTDVSLGENSTNTIQTGWGFTANNFIRSFTLGNNANYIYTQPTTGNTAPAVAANYASFRITQRFVLGEGANFQATRGRTTADSRFIWLTAANSSVNLGKNSTFDVSQSGGVFQVPTASTLNLDQGAKLNVLTERGLNTNINNAFRTINVGKEAEFIVKDGYPGQRTTAEFINRPLVNVGSTFNVAQDATVLLETTINKSLSSGVLFFRQANASLNLTDVKSFEVAHPSAFAGGSNGNLQRLIRSQYNARANGLRINIGQQKLTLWEGANQTATSTPSEEFINLSGVLRINRNEGRNATGLPAGTWTGGMNGVSMALLMTVESASGSITSNGKSTPIETAIAKNNYSRLRISEPEGLVARIDPLSDQSTEITGFMYEDSTIARITYQNTAGETVVITPDSVTETGERMIQWGEYRDADQVYRYFTIKLAENERLETDSKLNVFLSKPENEFYIDLDLDVDVIKGVEYEAYNITLDQSTIHGLSSEEALHELIIKESSAAAKNILTEEDLTGTIRLVDTNLTTAVTQDGTYYATLEVGNKAYQFTVGIDVTSSLDQMTVRIPTNMIFESMYNTQESNREFSSQSYEIRNNSYIGVDVKVNRMIVDDSAGITLLKEGENPLDYAEADPESEEENPVLTESDISAPLLELNLVTDRSSVQLYESMAEQDLVTMAAREQLNMSLSGKYYGDYPAWIVDSDYDDGGYYENNLVPQYRFVLRFIPK